MDSFEMNKLAGAALFALLMVFGLSVISDFIFASHSPDPPGFKVVVEDGDSGDDKDVADGEEDKPTLAQLLASADVGRGERQFNKCKSCHTSEKGGASKIGPPMWDVVDRPLAAVAGFNYSTALKDKGGNWTYELLDCFIKNPKKCTPGTKMAYAGLKRDDQRADLIVYLRSLSDDPKPLPEVETAAVDGEATEAEKAPAESADGEKAPAEGADAEKAPAESADAEKAPAESADAEKPAAESTDTETAPAESAPAPAPAN